MSAAQKVDVILTGTLRMTNPIPREKLEGAVYYILTTECGFEEVENIEILSTRIEEDDEDEAEKVGD